MYTHIHICRRREYLEQAEEGEVVSQEAFRLQDVRRATP